MSTISTLTVDLLTEIFTRLPVKSVIRCKSVCKLWRKLLTDPHFPKLHLTQSNSRNPNLLLTSDLFLKFHSIDCGSIHQALTLTPNLPPVVGIPVIGSCNGLICLSDSKTFVSIWNPATKECVEIPFDPIRPPEPDKRSSVVMGFGYDHVLDEYKVVRIVFYFDICNIMDFDCCQVKVFSLGSNSWRVIEGDGCSAPPCYIGNLSRVAYVNGVLHWVGIHGMGIRLSRSIVSFDVKDEKFWEISWPEFDDRDCRDLRLGVLHGCLSVFCYFMECVDVWVMKEYGMKESWTRLMSIQRPTKFLEPLAFRKSGEMVLQMGHRNLLLYDPVNQSSSVPCVYGIPDRFRTAMYEESLISVNSLMAGNIV